MTKDEEIKKLKQLCRWQYLTLGFYGTNYNYEEPIHNPITGATLLNIIDDHGFKAREAMDKIEELGFDRKDIHDNWPGIAYIKKEATS